MNRHLLASTTPPSRHLPQWLQQVFLLALLLALPACQSTNQLREAQNAFNAAASQDNRAQLADFRLSTSPGSPSTDWNKSPGATLDNSIAGMASSRAGYAAALLSLDQMSSKDIAQLKEDKLWGTALTLKALTQWRLGKFDDALNTVHEAEKSAAGQIYPRDAALLTALPGLIEIDYAYTRLPGFKANPTNATAVLDTWRQRLVAVNANPPSAVDQLRQARDQAGGQGELAVYLTLSQLAAFRNFSEFYKAATGNLWPENDPAYVEASYTLFDLEQVITNLNKTGSSGTTGQELVLAWKNRFVIAPKPRPTVPGPGQ